MNEFFTQLQQQVSRVWASLNTGQKVLFVLAPTVLIFVLIGAAYVASRPDYVPLVSTVDGQRLSEIVQYLQLNNINHEVRGNTILVPRNQRDRIRIDLAGQELLGPTTGPGFELFDVTRLGMTDRIFDAQYVRALQNELARTIRNGSRYDDVNVHLSIPKEALFKEDQALPSASVKVVASRRISQQEVIGMQNLVAGTVPRLTPENVKVFDRQNRPLRGVVEEEAGAALAQRQEEIRRKREAALYAKLAPLIEKVVGSDRYVLTVELELDWTQRTTKKRSLDPESQAPISEKTYEEESTSMLVAGEPGVGANVQDTGIGAAGVETPKTTISETITNYDYSISETEINFPIGRTIATHIMVALDYRKNPETGEWEPYPQEVIESLRQAIIKATGIDTKHNNPGQDTLSIESIEFDRSVLEAERRRYWLDQMRQLATSILPVVALGIIGILAYLFFQKAFVPRAAAEGEGEEVPMEPVTQAREMSLAQLGLAEFGDIASLPAEEQRRLKMQEHVINYAQEKPEDVAAIIKAWLSG